MHSSLNREGAWLLFSACNSTEIATQKERERYKFKFLFNTLHIELAVDVYASDLADSRDEEFSKIKN